MKQIIHLQSKNFVEIYNGKERYYGGNQEWFREKLLQDAGCGVIALTNMICYLTKQRILSQEDYIQKMYEATKFLQVWHIGDIPLGIWPSSRFHRAIQKMAKSYGISISSKTFLPRIREDMILTQIKEILARDIPLPMLLGVSTKFHNLPFQFLNGKTKVIADSSQHWVVITGLYQAENGKIYLRTSSWGGILDICFEDWYQGWWPQGIIKIKVE